MNGPLPQIVYFNGRRVAMGDDLEPIVLFDRAPAGGPCADCCEADGDSGRSEALQWKPDELKSRFQAIWPEPAGYWRREFLSAAVLIPSLSGKDSAADHCHAGQGDRPGGFEGARQRGSGMQFDSSLLRCRVHSGSAESDDEAGDAAPDG